MHIPHVCIIASDRPQSSSKGQPRSGGRADRDRADNRDRGDNRRVREDRDDRPPRGPRRPRLSSKEKDQVGFKFGGIYLHTYLLGLQRSMNIIISTRLLTIRHMYCKGEEGMQLQ